MDHKGRYTRGYLPHCDFPGSVQTITFRLADSVPRPVLEEWREKSAKAGADKILQRELRRKIAAFEDAGHGDCLLRKPELGEALQQQLLAGHGTRYRLMEWCVMPNHVHTLVSIDHGWSLGMIVKSWKGASAAVINRRLGRSGRLWMPDYHDRFIRDMDHFHDARVYIRDNPVKAGFCERAEEWRLSSAGVKWNPDIG